MPITYSGRLPGPSEESSETTGAGPGSVTGTSTSPTQQGVTAEHLQGIDVAGASYATAAEATDSAVAHREQEARKVAMGM